MDIHAKHTPVLTQKVIECLHPNPNENFIDCTVGQAGHTIAILERNGPKGRVLGIDLDKEALGHAKENIAKNGHEKRVILVQKNFSQLKEIVKEQKFSPVHGILLDLGMSSMQLEESGRGFSFKKTEPLDMRFDTRNPLTAAKIVNYWNKHDLERILREYGEEKFAKNIAEKICESRIQYKPGAKKEILTTARLLEIITKAVPGWYRRERLHFATKTFQALRIAVNNELESLEQTLPQAIDILEREGRIVVISFHSLEDRIVKNFFHNTQSIEILTKKPIIPSFEELQKNRRARSAKLRAAKKL
ncbi:MAG: 16S rRNA (cytosine(1402)-N(4))-methyltransferase RsmH [Candidatus Wildermuthbacteria bacterium]|nr:16S rRNA (cytosine(1402)-N(4))-methyltransferase RsmH [Candidatus Wildermuthbacteria bacterium]